MLAIRLNALGEAKYLTDLNDAIRQFEDVETAEGFRELFPETYDAEIVPSPLPGTGVPEINPNRGNRYAVEHDGAAWVIVDRETGKYLVGEGFTTRKNARARVRHLNRHALNT
jgi:hypothetical protein